MKGQWGEAPPEPCNSTPLAATRLAAYISTFTGLSQRPRRLLSFLRFLSPFQQNHLFYKVTYVANRNKVGSRRPGEWRPVRQTQRRQPSPRCKSPQPRQFMYSVDTPFWGHYQADNPPAVTNCPLMGYGGLMVCLRGAFQFYTGGPYGSANQRGHI